MAATANRDVRLDRSNGGVIQGTAKHRTPQQIGCYRVLQGSVCKEMAPSERDISVRFILGGQPVTWRACMQWGPGMPLGLLMECQTTHDLALQIYHHSHDHAASDV